MGEGTFEERYGERTGVELGPIECPLAYAPEPTWTSVAEGSVLEPGRVYRIAGMPMMASRYLKAEEEDLLKAPPGLEVQDPNPDQGEKHTATFEVLPDGYATTRWQGAREEEPYVQCGVCKATFPKRALFGEED